MTIYKECKALRLGTFYIDSALASKADKAVELVGNKRVVKGIIGISNRKNLLVLEGSIYGINFL